MMQMSPSAWEQQLLTLLPGTVRRVRWLGEFSHRKQLPGVRGLEWVIDPAALVDAVIVTRPVRPMELPEVLRQQRETLPPGGQIWLVLDHAQHFGQLASWLAGEPSEPTLWSRGEAYRTLLDAGYAPTLAGVISTTFPDGLEQQLQPVISRLRLHPQRTRCYLQASHLLLQALLLEDAFAGGAGDPIPPMTFVACVNDEQQLHRHLLASPCLGPGSPHEVLLFRGCRTAAEGLNAGLHQAHHDRVILLHQDVYLPAGWDQRFVRCWEQAEARWGRSGVVGVYGVSLQSGRVQRSGRVLDRDRLLAEPATLPGAVQTLDELLLGVHRDSGLRVDPALGWHFYGADLCLQARQSGRPALVLESLCWHDSRSVDFPAEFASSAAAFAQKWRGSLPLATSCVVIEANGIVRAA